MDEIIAKLAEVLSLFRGQMPDFNKKRADGDDIVCDAYEYLMRNFATESCKSKGQIYADVERNQSYIKLVAIRSYGIVRG